MLRIEVVGFVDEGDGGPIDTRDIEDLVEAHLNEWGFPYRFVTATVVDAAATAEGS